MEIKYEVDTPLRYVGLREVPYTMHRWVPDHRVTNVGLVQPLRRHVSVTSTFLTRLKGPVTLEGMVLIPKIYCLKYLIHVVYWSLVWLTFRENAWCENWAAFNVVTWRVKMTDIRSANFFLFICLRVMWKESAEEDRNKRYTHTVYCPR
jgi:hypothetical protein